MPVKEELCSNLNMEGFTDSDCMHAKKGFYIKKLGEYVDLYLKNDALLLADVFGKYREMCLRIYRLNQLLD